MAKYVRRMFIIVLFFISTPVNAEVFNIQSCSFVDPWVTISPTRITTELEFVSDLFYPLSAHPKGSVKSFEEYTDTFSNHGIGSVEKRLRHAKDEWLTDTSGQHGVVAGILKVIELVLSGDLGAVRESNCLEWGLFYKGMQEANIDLKTPMYLETSWSIWKRNNRLKIILEMQKSRLLL